VLEAHYFLGDHIGSLKAHVRWRENISTGQVLSVSR
jgi:hypothetical protein